MKILKEILRMKYLKYKQKARAQYLSHRAQNRKMTL